MNEKIISVSEIMTQIADLTPLGNSKSLPNVWKKVVSNIGKKSGEDAENLEITLGERLAANSHVVDYKNGVLLIEANHSGWIQYLKLYKNFIIKGISWALPDLKVNNLAFRIAGSNANLSNQYDDLIQKEKFEMSKKMDSDEKKLDEKFGQKKSVDNGSSSLPPELLARFENLKNKMAEDEK